MSKSWILGLFFSCNFALAFAQNACNCTLMDTFTKQRYFDSTFQHQKVNLWVLAKQFSLDKNPRCQAFAFQLKAQVQFKNEQYIDVFNSLEKEKYILDSLRCKQSSYIEYHVLSGDLLLVQNKLDEAIKHYGKALKLLVKAKNNALASKAYIGLAYAYYKKKDKSNTIYYTNLANGLVVKLTDNEMKVELLNQLASRYQKIVKVTKDLNFLDSASNTLSYSRNLASKMNYQESFLSYYMLASDQAFISKNQLNAVRYLDSALNYTSYTVNWRQRGIIITHKSDIYLDIKRYDKAYQFADSGYTYAKKSGDIFEIKNALELLYNTSKLSGDYERALSVYQEITFLNDSIAQLENKQSYNKLEEDYLQVRRAKSQAEYEQDQLLLEQQREIGRLKSRLILVGSIILALLFAYVFMVFRQKSTKQKQKKLEIQQRLNRASINPDFIFSALAKIQQEGERAGSDFKKQIQSFSKLLKQVLESNQDDFLTIDREIEFLTLYLNLQREKSKQAFEFNFVVDEAINPSNTCLPTMILHPFIENTVTDGFKQQNRPGQLTIYFKLKGLNELAIVIEDNGKGLKAIDSMRATEIINDRLYLLNKLNKTNASYLIRERVSGGIAVEIYIPLITKAYAEELRKEGF
ncbi:MAG TPA: histidine kinase [Fluviicola sp.]|nr:histidine kinase [Fluviicola sp.]